MLTFSRLSTLAVVALFLSACGGGGGSSGNNDGPTGGNSSHSNTSSGSGVNVNWPGNLIGERIEFTVQNPGTSGIGVGHTIIYDYDDGGVAKGTNPITNEVHIPDSYTYTINGNKASVRLYYSYSNGGAGYENYELTPYGSSVLEGTYEYQVVVTSGTSSGGTASGSYRIIAPAAVAIAVAEARELTERENETLSALLREEDMDRFVADSMFGYVALKNDGSIATFAPEGQATVSVFCGNVRCNQPNRLLSPPSGNDFVDIGFYQRAGLALSATGTYVSWGGETNAPVTEVSFTGEDPVNVRSLVQTGSGVGMYVVTNEGLVRLVYCNHPYTLNCQQPLQPEHTQAFESANDPLLAYLLYGRLYYIDQSWHVQISGTEHTLPTGLPTMQALAVGANFIVGLSRDGNLVAWTTAGESVPVPTEAQTEIVSVAIISRYIDGAMQQHVAAVKADGSARLWTYTGTPLQPGPVLNPSGIRQAVKVQATPFERFVFISGDPTGDGGPDTDPDGDETPFSLTGNWSVLITEDLSGCGIDQPDIYTETFVVVQNGSGLTVSDSLGSYSGSVTGNSLLWSGTYVDEDGGGTISVTASFDTSGANATLTGSSTWTFNDGEGFSCNGTSTFTGQRQ